MLNVESQIGEAFRLSDESFKKANIKIDVLARVLPQRIMLQLWPQLKMIADHD